MLVNLDVEQVLVWLKRASVPHFICDQCHGVHLSELQSLEGVLEYRLFVEEQGVMLNCELELRSGAIMKVLAQINRLNLDYPQLKIFLDISDSSLPRLMAGAFLHTAEGITYEQFNYFNRQTQRILSQLIHECSSDNLLFVSMEEEVLEAVH